MASATAKKRVWSSQCWALSVSQPPGRLEDARLAALLDCTVAVLTHLRLCRRPGAAAPERTAEQDIADIAGRFAIDAEALRRIVTEAVATKS
jgi:hypothetical protein